MLPMPTEVCHLNVTSLPAIAPIFENVIAKVPSCLQCKPTIFVFAVHFNSHPSILKGDDGMQLVVFLFFSSFCSFNKCLCYPLKKQMKLAKTLQIPCLPVKHYRYKMVAFGQMVIWKMHKVYFTQTENLARCNFPYAL